MMYIFKAFCFPIDAVESDMQNDTYNANTMEPGITVYGSWENDEKGVIIDGEMVIILNLYMIKREILMV